MNASNLADNQAVVSRTVFPQLVIFPFGFAHHHFLVFLAAVILFYSAPSVAQDVLSFGIGQIEEEGNVPALTDARAFVSLGSFENPDGDEFGIGYATFMLGEGDEAIERIGAARLVEAENRIYYSFVEAPAMRKLKTFFQIPLENRIRDHKIWFLFKNANLNSPLRLRMRGTGVSREVRVVIEKCDQGKFQRKYADRWRKQFLDAMAAQRSVNDFPSILEDYLESMLLARVGSGKSQKRDDKKKDKKPGKSLTQTVGLLLDLESTRSSLITKAMKPELSISNQRLALPLPIRLPVKPSTALPRAVVVEEIAKVVPASCFYLRFGNWDNQIWLKGLMEEYGGDLSRMLTVRGYKNLVQSKFLDQLCVQSGPLDKWFGGTKINDVALIGSDFYFRSGAGVGVVLQAQTNQTESLRKNFKDKRKKIVQEAKERILARVSKASGFSIDDIDSVWQGEAEEVEFDGHDVDFIETRVSRVDVKNDEVLKATLEERVLYRSYYVVKGDFHLITTSAEIVREFLKIQVGKGVSLGDSEDFRAFRSKDPFQKGSQNRILFFASNSFLENLFKPSFQIELARRNRLVAKIQVLEMATLAAVNEGVNLIENDNVFDKLIDRNLLPKRFDQQNLERNGGSWVDRERGRFGFFKPVADVDTGYCTESERKEYQTKKVAVENSIKDLEPVYFHLDRSLKEAAGQVEIVSVDSRITAIGEDELDWGLGRLGPVMEREIEWNPETGAKPVVQLNLSLKKKAIFKPSFDYRMFLVVDDGVIPDVNLKPTSILQFIKSLKEVPGFVAADPPAGVLDWFFPRQRSESVFESGENRVIRHSRVLDVYRLEDSKFLIEDAAGVNDKKVNGFNAVSGYPDRLRGVGLRNVPIGKSDRSQVHLKIDGLRPEIDINRWVNSINYRRSWQTSIANVKFMNFVSRQLGADTSDVQAICQDLLGVELVCSLGGSYQLVGTEGGVELIFSNAWPDFVNPVLPTDYQAPVLGWFRGCELKLSKEVDGGRFELTGTLDVERKSAEFELPLFNGFKGLFGGGSK